MRKTSSMWLLLVMMIWSWLPKLFQIISLKYSNPYIVAEILIELSNNTKADIKRELAEIEVIRYIDKQQVKQVPSSSSLLDETGHIMEFYIQIIYTSYVHGLLMPHGAAKNLPNILAEKGYFIS